MIVDIFNNWLRKLWNYGKRIPKLKLLNWQQKFQNHKQLAFQPSTDSRFDLCLQITESKSTRTAKMCNLLKFIRLYNSKHQLITKAINWEIWEFFFFFFWIKTNIHLLFFSILLSYFNSVCEIVIFLIW